MNTTKINKEVLIKSDNFNILETDMDTMKVAYAIIKHEIIESLKRFDLYAEVKILFNDKLTVSMARTVCHDIFIQKNICLVEFNTNFIIACMLDIIDGDRILRGIARHEASHYITKSLNLPFDDGDYSFEKCLKILHAPSSCKKDNKNVQSFGPNYYLIIDKFTRLEDGKIFNNFHLKDPYEEVDPKLYKRISFEIIKVTDDNNKGFFK